MLAAIFLQRAQEIQEVLFVLVAALLEEVDDAVGFGAVACVGLNSGEQTAVGGSGAAIVEEEQALAYSPQRRGAEFIGACRTLRNAVGESGAHVVNKQVGKQSCTLTV